MQPCVRLAVFAGRTPNSAHFEQTRLCLKAGKHVLCEKPLARNSTESSHLVQLAAECGRADGVNYNIRYYPLCIEAAQRRKAGQLGKIYHVAGSYVQDWLLLPTDFNWRVLSSESGLLRAVADIGTHWLDLIFATLKRTAGLMSIKSTAGGCGTPSQIVFERATPAVSE